MYGEHFNIKEDKIDVPKNILGGLVGCASHIGSKTINEDAFKAENLGRWKIVILADGLGSYQKAKEAAWIVVDTFHKTLIDANKKRQQMSFDLFKRCYKKAALKIKDTASGGVEELMTTVIGVVETTDSFFITYLGDGEIWVRRGDGYAIPLLMPHRVGSGLVGLITPEGIRSNPVFIQFSKSFETGEMIVAGTDGVFEEKNDYNGYSSLIYNLMDQLNNKKPLTNSDFNEVLADLLGSIHEKYVFFDNATLGIIVSEKLHLILGIEDDIIL